MCLYPHNAPHHYKFISDFIERSTSMEQNIQNVHSYKKTPAIALPEIPWSTFHVKLLPAFISKRPSGITIYHVTVTFGLSLQCLNGWIIKPTSIEAVSAKRRTKAGMQV
jgi:hypothetical protein